MPLTIVIIKILYYLYCYISITATTVGAQSIARLCQNLVNCRGNTVSLPTEDAESCGFFYSKDLRLESELIF
jgi:hypothetical protein